MQSRLFHSRWIAVLLSAYMVSQAVPPCEVRAQDIAADAANNDKASGDSDKTSGDNDKKSGEKEKKSGGKDFLDMDIEQLRKTSVAPSPSSSPSPSPSSSSSPSSSPSPSPSSPSLGSKVTSVAKRESTVGKSPAAIFVITPEMIRRSGCTTIPDLLRMVPGVQVAQINSHIWAITVRGFNGLYANKLLVLVDGRSVYNEVSTGVYWDTVDLVLDDIERIEVIRGPGGTLWGVNAMNGVINIVTKKAQDTLGTYVSVGGGSHDRLIDSVRVGRTNGEGLYWRIYGKQFERGPDYSPIGAEDAWRMGRGGFRLDWDMDKQKRDTFTVQGDYYGGLEGQKILYSEPNPPYGSLVLDETNVAGANVLARFTHVIDDRSDWHFQTYFDRTFRKDKIPDGTLINTQQINTFDVEFQHRFPLGNNHSITWGTNYRLYRDYLPGSFVTSFDPEELTLDIFNMFVQDEITIREDLLAATVGCKFSNEYFTGFQYQPTVRLIWTPDERHAAWAAVSRAVRTPSRSEEDFTANQIVTTAPIPTFVRVKGEANLVAESMMGYELGYRAQTSDRFTWDIALFYNVYYNIGRSNRGTPFPESTYEVIPVTLANAANGQTYGLELCGQWTLSDRWRVSSWYGFLKMQTATESGRVLRQGNSPQDQAYLQSSWDLSDNWRFDTDFRYVDYLPRGPVPRYIEMDLRLAWSPNDHFEAALVGQNLLNAHHYEFREQLNNQYRSNEVPRSVYGSVTWRY